MNMLVSKIIASAQKNDPGPWPVDVPLPSRTEDDAVAAVGFHDAMAAENLAQLRQYETTLANEIEDKQEALGLVREAIARLTGQQPVSPSSSKRKKGREA